MLTNIISRWPDILKLKAGQMIPPSFVDFHTSNACNQHCIGCAYAGAHDGKCMSRDDHFRAVDILLDAGVKAFDFAGGGDPCMLPYLTELLNWIGDRGAHFGIITNGTMLTAPLANVISRYGTYCRVSLEASSQEDYWKYKRSDLWPIVMRNLKLLSWRDERKCQVSLKFAVSKTLRGEEHYKNALRTATYFNVDRVYFKSLRHQPEELNFVEESHESVVLQAVLDREPRWRGRVYSSVYPRALNKVPQCWLNPLHTVMDHNGDLYLCCYYYYRNGNHKLGNIFAQPFDKLWYSPEHREKVSAINREECAKVDCKFFAHHEAVESLLKTGEVYFL